MAPEDDRVELEVVADLPDRFVLEQRPEHSEHLAAVEAAVEPEARSFERDIARLPRLGGEGEPDDRRPHGRGRVGQDAQREAAGLLQFGRKRLHVIDRVEEAVVLADGLRSRRELHDERAESEPRKQLEAALL